MLLRQCTNFSSLIQCAHISPHLCNLLREDSCCLSRLCVITACFAGLSFLPEHNRSDSTLPIRAGHKCKEGIGGCTNRLLRSQQKDQKVEYCAAAAVCQASSSKRCTYHTHPCREARPSERRQDVKAQSQQPSAPRGMLSAMRPTSETILSSSSSPRPAAMTRTSARTSMWPRISTWSDERGPPLHGRTST